MPVRFLLFFFGCCLAGGLFGGCANILPPSGGDRDTVAPRLLSVKPADSGRNIFPQKITLRFDEYINVADAATQIQISPLLAQNISAEADLRTVTLTLPDTLLQPNTTYRIQLGTAVRDLHEDNPFRNYTYTFSTGSYFDSLQLSGQVLKAETGAPDTSVQVLLHEATAGDSAVLRQKPQYVVPVDGNGNFRFTGLPDRPFRIYALGDQNSNLLFDKADERIAFLDSLVRPTLSDSTPIALRSFAEATADTTAELSPEKDRRLPAQRTAVNGRKGTGYMVGVDTSNNKRRTVSLLRPVDVSFSGTVIKNIASSRIFLTRDSNGTAVETPVAARRKPDDSSVLQIRVDWQPDALYTLRLLKGFVRDAQDEEALPGKWTFRTKAEADYARLTVNVAAKYRNAPHVLQVLLADKDTIWQRPIETKSLLLPPLEPGIYTLRIIEDRNRNGMWDPGNLLQGKQPERVFPLDRKVTLKAGWENIVDWE